MVGFVVFDFTTCMEASLLFLGKGLSRLKLKFFQIMVVVLVVYDVLHLLQLLFCVQLSCGWLRMRISSLGKGMQ